jgi:hypothetical protein
MDQIPSRVLDLLSTLRPRAGAASHDVLDALQRHPRASPVWDGSFSPHPGSTHRFSQPLSGFPASSSSTALFRAATVPGRPPFRAFPSRGSPAPLEAACSLAVIHRRARRAARDRSSTVSPTSTRFAQSPGSPADYELPFGGLTPTSRLLGSRTAKPPLPPASPASKPSSPRESVRADSGCPAPTAAALLGFFPFRDPHRPRSLDPPRQSLDTAPRPQAHAPRPRGPAAPAAG